ncbi:MAG TPA: mechanosensitive ion channel domain-containing protein [Gemmatimonadales bacterium]|nr:mechanosensitive ion channel domain-containing protein [Gemmatimonadales bacterium]
MNDTFRTLQDLLFAQPVWLQTIVGLALLGVAVVALHLLLRPVVLSLVKWLVDLSPIEWDGTLFDHHVPHRLSRLIPLLALRVGLPMVPGLSDGLTSFLTRLVSATMILVVARTIDALLSAAHSLYQRTEMAATRPIKSYVQLVKLVVYLIAGVFIIARLANQSPWFFVSGLGAMMAIILIIFRDTLLSLVASIQLSNNDLIRVGDWIEMPQFGADGDVVDIALTSVKVVNWDKTTTVIPTHKFLDNSFKNWRGMFELGGRRIKRAININISSIRFLTEEEIERFSQFVLLKDYIARKVAELQEYNEPYADDPDAIVNARRMTNVGTLRAYIASYLHNHPRIHQDMTVLVRQLAPNPEGLPLELYMFTNDTRWSQYEDIQSDIFDHILAIMPEFDLEVYQRPSGRDLGHGLGVRTDGGPHGLGVMADEGR